MKLLSLLEYHYSGLLDGEAEDPDTVQHLHDVKLQQGLGNQK